MKRLKPDTLAARTLVVLILGLAFSHAISVALYVSDRNSALVFNNGEHFSERIATIDLLVANASRQERERILRLTDDPRLRVILTASSIAGDQPKLDQNATILRNALVTHLNRTGKRDIRLQRFDELPAAFRPGNPVAAPADHGKAGMMVVSLALPDRSWLNFAVPVEVPETLWSLRFGLSMAVMLLAVGVLSAVVVHYLTRPLATFTRAAQRLGVDVKAPPLPENGPAEIRQLIRAFNEMQDRIRRFVEDRTQMIAAISHDLGTPITRMRIRAEFVGDDDQRRKILADLDDMEKMTSSALSFARNEATHEPRAIVDLRTLLQRCCDDAGDAGLEVELEIGDEAVPYACRPAALRRAVTNLVENAVKYGHRARVSMTQEAATIQLTIDDDGPGIPEDRRDDVFKPFRRLETSRSRETGGTGLGLTVARTIVRAQGGDITLNTNDGGGLRVEVKLPL